jgi:lipopolysaccharide/colanic/teichoic acid biosynthesis glycosyltransferase
MIKRAFDLIVAIVGCVILCPIFILIALCIKLSSSGPVLFCQTRIGKDGKPFTFYKFRTMVHLSDDSQHRAYVKQLIRGEAPQYYDPRTDTYVYRMIGDPRITRLGALLRKSSLDELPQLINVIKGDMSLVGPRPPIAYEVDAYAPWHRQRLQARPGITGIWQVRGRGLVTFDEMVLMDIDYIKQQSFWLDLKILYLTPRAVIAGKGAGLIAS